MNTDSAQDDRDDDNDDEKREATLKRMREREMSERGR